MIFLLF